eukprot:9922314-Ditylum_brightwellii.AAC.1
MAAEDIALAISAYESAFCADIVASYIFKVIETCFLQANHRGIYQDNGLVIFTGKWTKMKIACWPSQNQTLSPAEPSTNKSNNKSNNNDNNINQQQTCSPMEKWLKRAKLCMKNVFPFIDMKMMWDNMRFLHFGVYHKEGEAI